MPGRILDTSVLVNHWRAWRNERMSVADACAWAARLVEVRQTNLIVSPVYLEFVCGARSAGEVALAESYLSAFEVKDGWDIRSADLHEARRLARRISRGGKPRQFADCLIRALATRLRCDVVLSHDKAFPRP